MDFRKVKELVLILAVFCSSPNLAVSVECSETPTEYKTHDYGDLLFSLESSCVKTLSQKEQLFVAGLSQRILETCSFPSDPASRLVLTRFLSSSAFVGVIGGQYGNPDLGRGLQDQAQSMSIYSAGAATLDWIGGCNPHARLIADGVVHYLRKTASKGPNNTPNYVEGCVRYYSGKYTEEQCQCIADLGRAIFPNIHQTDFSPKSIKRMIEANPFVGLMVGIQCRVGDY
uniref:Uncharacterized protein n=1 Tax=Candidatus Kentrum sp. FW TaxID=2126338 RepID=A0A450RXJ0_9GAMM|nr:MAG: hypothetical protein BECKFW1821A_GA0114235_100543 [Candidatus Kentron sp. FW]